VLDPVARRITHLVVEPRHRHNAGHLVPIEYVAGAGQEIHLTCTLAELNAFDEAQERQLVTLPAGHLGYEQSQVLAWPYYALRAGAPGAPGASRAAAAGAGARVVSHDKLPLGEVQVRRGEPVLASDGAIGRVQGLVIDPDDRSVTHFLLEEGHIWDQKRVAIPIGAVTSVQDGVRLSLSKDEVRDLPAVELA
jgi:sporulation protein YlmC with PRC-barrel domain